MIKKVWYIDYPTGGRPYLYLLVQKDGVYLARASVTLYPDASLADCARRLEANLGV